ncbi:hypothetical protein A2U01_0083533, partial [Trifolium medium]|nr:hypothetical protein [Trifolium medium]
GCLLLLRLAQIRTFHRPAPTWAGPSSVWCYTDHPRLPSQAADPLATQDHISAQFVEYLDRVLTPEQRGLAAIYPWYAAPGYMRWYFR